jgi:anti-anti-sigma factor
MEVTTRTVGDVTIIAILGSLDSNTAPQAKTTLDAVGTSAARKVAVDFAGLDYVSSAGLRVLLGLAKQLNGKGGALRTFGLNQSVREVFEISGFATILKTFPTEADALAGF